VNISLISIFLNRYVLKPLEKLTHLYLNHNQIRTIDPLAFVGIRMVEFITLQDNNIQFRDEFLQASPFQNLKQLETLNLGNNSITTIFEDFTLESLKYLNLSSNQISSLSTNDLNNLMAKTIDLTYNDIHEINFDFDINQTVHVLVDHNPISCDCRLHKFVKHLRHKNGNDAKQKITIGSLTCATPEKLANRKVENIDPFELVCPLDNPMTKIKKCPEGCECKTRPEDKHALLKCNSNVDFTKMPVADQQATELIIVMLNDNNMTIELPLIQSPGYELITNLTLNDNQMSLVLPENLPPRLQQLYLHNNKFETLNETVRAFINNLTSLQNLSLRGNPWKCDCPNKGFISFVKKLNFEKKVVDFFEIECVNGAALSDVDEATLCSEDENLFFMIFCITTAIMGLVLGGLAALYYKYQKQIKMWLYSHNMLLWFVTEEELDKVCSH
jgi:protein toll